MYDGTRLTRGLVRYIQNIRQGGLTEKYVREQERLLTHFREFCRSRNVNAPSKITQELLRDWTKQFEYMSITYQKHILVSLRGFLKFTGNPLALDFKVKLIGTSRRHIRWISDEQLSRIFEAPMKPPVAVMIHLGVLMLLRRCEILRIRWSEAEEALRTDYLTVHGKGYKPRAVRLHPDVREVLLEYMKLSPRRKDPMLLLGFARARADDLLKEFWRDNNLRRFSFHDLRRTGATNYFEAKTDQGLRAVEVAVLARMMGHKDEAQTLEYIGNDLRQMQKAMECVRVSKIRTFSAKPAV